MLASEEVYDVTMVKDGKEAFDTVNARLDQGSVFDLIFMDIQVSISVSSIKSTSANRNRCPIWTACREPD
jgi:osomolarity two-component system sensor histidine kinase SLN1